LLLSHLLMLLRVYVIGYVLYVHIVGIREMSSNRRRQSNFAALNRGRHLYLAGRPSRGALTHILVSFMEYRLPLCS